MTSTQIIKIIFLVLMVLTASVIFVLGAIMKGTDNTPAGKRKFRTLLKIRLGCFIGMLAFLLVVFLLP